MQDFRKLRVWHLARDLELRVINGITPQAARRVPGLRSQAIRAAGSVSANIVEGCGRPLQTEFLQFLGTALASVNVLQKHLMTASDAKIVSPKVSSALNRTLEVERRMLIALMRTLQEHVAHNENSRRDSMNGGTKRG